MGSDGNQRKKAETKRQHYVPRFILRKFSPDEKRISLLVMETGFRTDEAAISKQCYEDYLYGPHDYMETSFTDEETKISQILSNLSREALGALGDEPRFDLQKFVYWQRTRTVAAGDEMDSKLDAVAKNLMGSYADLNPGKSSFTREDLDLVNARFNNATNEALWHAAKAWPIVWDLKVKFIVTDRTPGFVISDHPVVAYNQFAEHHPKFRRYPATVGLAVKGLQFFMPISPSVTIALYDPATYEFGNSGHVCTAGPADVGYLNAMQVVNACDCIYYLTERITEAELTHLREIRANHPPMRTSKVLESPPLVDRADGSKSNIIALISQELRVGATFSFGRVTDKGSYRKYDFASLPLRSPQLFEFSEMLDVRLEGEVAKERQRRGLPPEE